MRKIFDKLYNKSFEEFNKTIFKNLKYNKKMFIVTSNPETFMIANQEKDFKTLLLNKDTTIVADGIGIVKSARMLGYKMAERVPGIDISINLLKYGNQLKKDLYLFGSTDEVITKMKSVLDTKYSNIKLVGSSNGYVNDKDKVFEEIISLKPDIILVALGIPEQEKLIYKHLSKFEKGIFIGVGGSLDVISGYKKRAPKILIKLNLEWLYRILKEPKRIKRFYQRNIKFIVLINKKYKK